MTLERGSILKVVRVEEGRHRITVVDRSGNKRVLEALKSKIEESGEFPEGTLESLYPIMQRVLVEYPQISPPEYGFWISLEEKARFSYEKAVNLVRSRGKSSEEVGEVVVMGVLGLAGINTRDIPEQILSQIITEASGKIKEIYRQTTQSSPRK